MMLPAKGSLLQLSLGRVLSATLLLAIWSLVHLSLAPALSATLLSATRLSAEMSLGLVSSVPTSVTVSAMALEPRMILKAVKNSLCTMPCLR
jgi:hypothetical protein